MISERVGQRIRQLRVGKGLTQVKLALKAGLDRSYMSGIERGKRNLSIFSLEKI